MLNSNFAASNHFRNLPRASIDGIKLVARIDVASFLVEHINEESVRATHCVASPVLDLGTLSTWGFRASAGTRSRSIAVRTEVDSSPSRSSRPWRRFAAPEGRRRRAGASTPDRVSPFPARFESSLLLRHEPRHRPAIRGRSADGAGRGAGTSLARDSAGSSFAEARSPDRRVPRTYISASAFAARDDGRRGRSCVPGRGFP